MFAQLPGQDVDVGCEFLFCLGSRLQQVGTDSGTQFTRCLLAPALQLRVRCEDVDGVPGGREFPCDVEGVHVEAPGITGTGLGSRGRVQGDECQTASG